jgi:hypothetical protein
MKNCTLLSCAMLLCVIAGCTSETVLKEPAPFVEAERPVLITVTRTDGKIEPIARPRILEDTLFGFTSANEQVTMPMSQVRSIRVRQQAPTRTLALVSGIAVGVFAAAILLKGSGPSPADSSCGRCGGRATPVVHVPVNDTRMRAAFDVIAHDVERLVKAL